MPIKPEFGLKLLALHANLFAHQADIGAFGSQHLMLDLDGGFTLI